MKKRKYSLDIYQRYQENATWIRIYDIGVKYIYGVG